MLFLISNYIVFLEELRGGFGKVLNLFFKQFSVNLSEEFSRKTPHQSLYAHMLIVVAFLVVKIFGFLVITRYHDSFDGCH